MGPPVPRCFSPAITRPPPPARRSQPTPPPPHHQLLLLPACASPPGSRNPLPASPPRILSPSPAPPFSRPAAACTVVLPPRLRQPRSLSVLRPPASSVPAVSRCSLSFLAKATQQRSWLGSALACFLAFLGLFDSHAAARFLVLWMDWVRRWNYYGLSLVSTLPVVLFLLRLERVVRPWNYFWGFSQLAVPNVAFLAIVRLASLLVLKQLVKFGWCRDVYMPYASLQAFIPTSNGVVWYMVSIAIWYISKPKNVPSFFSPGCLLDRINMLHCPQQKCSKGIL